MDGPGWPALIWLDDPHAQRVRRRPTGLAAPHRPSGTVTHNKRHPPVS